MNFLYQVAAQDAKYEGEAKYFFRMSVALHKNSMFTMHNGLESSSINKSLTVCKWYKI
jgi:hypothetical protein